MLVPSSGSVRFRAAPVEIADGVWSSAGADLRKLIKRSGLPDPLYNPRPLAGDEFIAMWDAWWPEAGGAAMVDSRQWHWSPADWERTMAPIEVECPRHYRPAPTATRLTRRDGIG